MKYQEVTARIIEVCQMPGLDFTEKGDRLLAEINACSPEEVIEHLEYAGVIPECFGHDSTEEKVFAKYCDALLARAWRDLGLDSDVIQLRSDAADVKAQGNGYTIVGDAKAFRLSRTAKNQKDFKIEALNSWRKGADYACLVGPLNQFPNTTSQIYLPAVTYNVTILSFIHLVFLLRYPPNDIDELEQLWQFPGQLEKSKSAKTYWGALNSTMLSICGMEGSDLQKLYDEAYARLPKQGREQIRHWEGIVEDLKRQPREALEEALVKALKINSKIDVIKKAARI